MPVIEHAMAESVTTLAHAWGGPVGTALFKQQEDDFLVDEILGFEPDGTGEHVFWQVEKRGISTSRLIDHLSARLGMPRRLLSWAGMKDRHSLSTQWISIHAGLNVTPDPEKVESDNVRVLSVRRNSRKLRIGSHRGNRFRITLRGLTGPMEDWLERLALIAREGVPNYVGQQRFGRHGSNMDKVRDMFAGHYRPRDRNERSILLSAARSHLFNRVLSDRVTDGVWNQAVDGDIFMLEGSQRCFTPDWLAGGNEAAATLAQRVLEYDIHPTGPLTGKMASAVTGIAAGYELVASSEAELVAGLAKAGMDQDRRALRLLVQELQAVPATGQALVVEFTLCRGAYATSVLRELLSYADTAGSQD